MNDFKFDQEAYLKRINYAKEPKVSLECLRELHYAQLFTMPFENFDVVLGRGIALEPNKLFHKLVHNKRGGYCFELNGLFLMALQTFGFDARALLGRVHTSGTPSGKTHQITLVTIDGNQWITDVGFGNSTMQGPIPLLLNEPTHIYQQTFRLVETHLYGMMLQIFRNEEWKDQYSFTLSHVFPNDIALGNYYTSTSPDSIFVKSRIAALPTKHGTNTLRNYTLRQYNDGQSLQEQLEENQDYIDSLSTYFGIELDASIGDLRPLEG
ncbi:MAG: arylamine N-acetyltransferase [Chloroflexota bacterium]